MEARRSRSLTSLCMAALVTLGMAITSPTFGASYRTANFTVDAPSAALAKEIGDAAESWRSSLALEWLGGELPDWAQACPIKARVAPRLGAGGATSFVFDQGEVFGWRMNIQGSRERILDSVLPHEITHTLFACHFRQPLPRWADEGACTTVEHESEIARQEQMLIEILHTRRGIPFSDMFAMKEYPRDVMPLYAQGHALAEMLIGKRGKKAFLEFLKDGMSDENWPRALRAHYGYDNLLVLQNSWLDWIRAGRPDSAAIETTLAEGSAPRPSPPVQLASAETPEPLVYRGQDPGSRKPAEAQGVGGAAMPRTASSPYSATGPTPFSASTASTPNRNPIVVTAPWTAVRSRATGSGDRAIDNARTSLRDTGAVRR